jgi:hypothetical protein
VAGDHGLELLTQGADGTLTVARSIDANLPVDVGTELAVAPDGHAVTYRREAALFLRTVPDGVERQLAPNHAGCASWAPDGRHVSYLHEDDGLIVTDLQGHLTVVDRVKHAAYDGGQIAARSEVGCGKWLDSNRLAFSRVNAMPATIQTNGMSSDVSVDVDTMTVATLGGSAPKLLNSPLTWQLVGACGPHLLTQTQDDKDDALYLVNNPSDADFTSGTTLTAPTARIEDVAPGGVFFLPGSCQPVVLTAHTADGTTELRPIDAGTRKVADHALMRLGEGVDLDPPAGGRVTWPTDATGQTAVTTGDIHGQKSLMVVNLAAGTTTPLRLANGYVPSDVLAWLP